MNDRSTRKGVRAGRIFVIDDEEAVRDIIVSMLASAGYECCGAGRHSHGAYDCLLKPFEREQLLNAVRRALENRRFKLEHRALCVQSGSAGSRPYGAVARPEIVAVGAGEHVPGGCCEGA